MCCIMLLLPSKLLTKACMSYSEWSKMKKKAADEEKYEENKTNFEGAYLSDGWEDSTRIWNRRCPTSREFSQQNWLFSIQAMNA